MKARKKWRLAIGLAVIVLAGVGVAAALQQLRGTERDIPTARVKRGTLELKTYTTGELRPARTGMLMAPPVSGTLQIVHLATAGSLVQKDEVVLEFDPSEQEYNLEQNRSILMQAEQEITKQKADMEVQASQDRVALLQAHFDVRRAELDVSKNELESAIDAQKNDLALAEAKRRQAQLEQDVKSREVTGKAALAVLEEKRNKARLDMQVAQQNIDKMTIRSPLTGLVSVKENRDAMGGFWSPGVSFPEYHMGDLVSPGRNIADVLEVSEMEILSHVPETDRANITPGQLVEVQVDALPGQSYRGKVKNVSGMAARVWGGEDPTRKFDATFQLDHPDDRLRPGVTAQVIIVGDQVRDALYVPRQAVFDRDGKPIVYVRNGKGFEAREIKIRNRNESQVAIEGLAEGAEVALVNPESEVKKPGSSPAAGPAISGGGR